MVKEKNKKKVNKIQNKIKGFPLKVLRPVANFLTQEVLRLERKKKDLSKEDPFADSRRIVDNASPDTDAVEQIGHDKVQALVGQINRKIIQLKKALTRIKIGKYGICEKCGQMIDTDRLMIVPESTVCIKCEKKKEK